MYEISVGEVDGGVRYGCLSLVQRDPLDRLRREQERKQQELLIPIGEPNPSEEDSGTVIIGSGDETSDHYIVDYTF